MDRDRNQFSEKGALNYSITLMHPSYSIHSVCSTSYKSRKGKELTFRKLPTVTGTQIWKIYLQMQLKRQALFSGNVLAIRDGQ